MTSPLERYRRLKAEADRVKEFKARNKGEWLQKAMEAQHLAERADAEVRRMTLAERVQAGLLRRDDAHNADDGRGR